MAIKTYHGLFVGLVTLDLVYLATSAPSNNQKIVASDYTVASGGPATNAAALLPASGCLRQPPAQTISDP